METVVHVDAFADRPFAGNPAAVCLLTEPRDEEWMRRLAGETNLPATVFIQSQADGYSVRWFTPSVELTLCGHGTLAAAHTLWSEGIVDFEMPIAFHARTEILTAIYEEGWIQLDFPAVRTRAVDPPEELLQALCAAPKYVGRSDHSYLVELGTEAEVRSLKPDISRLSELDLARVIVTARAETGEFDFVSRFFAPALGIIEDSVTGSAHCVLGPYWAEQLGKTKLTGFQASARGGVVRAEVKGDRVVLGGQAVTVLRSQLRIE